VAKRAFAALGVLAVCAAVAGNAGAADQPWRDASQPPLTRANELLAALSFDQKVDIAMGQFGSTASFGVPPLTSDDGPSGVRADGTTTWPSSQTLASTFDRRLARAYGGAIAAELRGKGFNTWLGPAMDIARVPLAGRQPENLGEDPFLAGHTVAAEIKGVKSGHAMETLKHYVANNQEYERTGFAALPTGGHAPAINAIVSERTLQEIYEAPFRTAVQRGGADGVMCSYNRVNGTPTCESHQVLDPLKHDWGFNGFVVPDFAFAVRDGLAAANAGVDFPALPGDFTGGLRTRDMFTSGQISAARLDDMVRRILFAMFDSGVFDDPVGAPAAVVTTPEHQALAKRMSESGMVLLKNDDQALPLSTRHLRSLAVIGPSGTDARYITGGSAAVPITAGPTITPLAGITARAGGVKINAAQGSLGDVPLPTTVPADVLTPASGGGHGLSASYWSNGDRQGAPTRTQVDPTVDVAASPTDLGPVWSASWTGTLTPPETGLYRLTLHEAGIAKLFVNDRLITSGYREATQFLVGPQYPESGTAFLTKGRPVRIRIEYSSKSGLFGHSIQLEWQPPSASGIGAAVAAAKRSDVAVVFANNAQGEGMDRDTLALPGDQDALIEAVAAVNRHTVVVLNDGSPVLMPWLHHVDAVLQAWYPGQQFGAALASVLFGDSDPGGRLPVTYPASDAQGPAPPTRPERYPGVNSNERYDEGLLVGYRWYDAVGQKPQFPFGYGLSYASFKLRDLEVDTRRDTVDVSLRVTNTSRRAGSEVVQLYLSHPRSADEPPKQLKGYKKVALDPGESRWVDLRLRRDDLAVFDGGWSVPRGTYTVQIGTSSRDLPLRGRFTVR
jgi:beta-glucosidase